MSEKKLIIDEDWKSQVQAEKAAAAKEADSSTPPSAGEKTASSGPQLGDTPMPPASLEMLLTTLATEALVALGQIPHPANGQTHVHRHQAQYLIDTIDMLRQKTKGNITPDEQQMFDRIWASIEQKRPSLMLVQLPLTNGFNTRDYFSTDPRFRELFDHASLVATVGIYWVIQLNYGG